MCIEDLNPTAFSESISRKAHPWKALWSKACLCTDVYTGGLGLDARSAGGAGGNHLDPTGHQRFAPPGTVLARPLDRHNAPPVPPNPAGRPARCDSSAGLAGGGEPGGPGGLHGGRAQSQRVLLVSLGGLLGRGGSRFQMATERNGWRIQNNDVDRRMTGRSNTGTKWAWRGG